jgi:LysR family transcriptional regulator, hydrogen peroxide-inducible genes activator
MTKKMNVYFFTPTKKRSSVYFSPNTKYLKNKMIMTIIQLEYLIAVDTYKNFAEAAQSCYVSQPALSMQIKKVEDELGVLVFDRSKKPVLTTEIGKLILQEAREMIRQSRRIEEIVKNQKGEIGGELRIGIIPTLSPYLLPLFITKFMKKYPSVKLVIEELLTDDIVGKLNHDLLDVGILISPLNESTIIEIPLFYEPFMVYTSKNHPFSKRTKINAGELEFGEMWVLQEGHCFRNQTINLCSDRISETKGQLRFESGSLETLKRIVEHQNGYTLLPELATYGMEASKSRYIKSFQDPQPVREISLATHRSFMKQNMIQAFKEEILANIPNTLKSKPKGKIINWR